MIFDVCHVIGDKSLLLTEKKNNRSLAQIGNINVLTSKIPFDWQLDLSWTHFRLISSSDTAQESSWQARVVFDFSGRLMKTLKLLWSKRFKLKREYGVNIYGLFCFIACGWSSRARANIPKSLGQRRRFAAFFLLCFGKRRLCYWTRLCENIGKLEWAKKSGIKRFNDPNIETLLYFVVNYTSNIAHFEKGG